ncbi:MAG: 1-acyl-sn-glycerol-3-phosphate acyltransferase [Rhodobacteraceae bacterium]|nr:1-acyl-sn-glycerol-3-phosphate acyltransferase [Paracoccaceae bacterium]
MAYTLQWLRSLTFMVQMYLVMLIMGLFFFPWAIVHRQGAYTGVRIYCRWVRWTASWMIGLTSEIRGKIPKGELLIAGKHQSFFDVIMMVSVVAKPKFIMKSSLIWAPILGQYALRIGCVPVVRGKRSEAIKFMMEQVQRGTAPAGQLIIYPQGTRVVPGDRMPYKIGTAVLYRITGQVCIPAATNVGIFWPRYGIYRSPGHAVVEFLPAIEQGLEKDDFMNVLEDTIETRSNELMQGAGFNGIYKDFRRT